MPPRTLQNLFSSRNIELSDQEVRRDMGLPEKEHIRSILSMGRIREAWARIYGNSPVESDVDAMYFPCSFPVLRSIQH